MSSKTILIGLSVFRKNSDKSVHGRPSWEFAPYDIDCLESLDSEITTDFVKWSKHVSRVCCFDERAGECGVMRFTSQFFLVDKSKSIPIRIGSQTAWEVTRSNYIDNRDKVSGKDYELHGMCTNFWFMLSNILIISSYILLYNGSLNIRFCVCLCDLKY